MRNSVKALTVVLPLAASGVTSVSFAEESNPYIVHRQAIYNIAAGHMNALKSILLLDHPSKQDVNFHATQMLEAFKHLGKAYPEGTEEGETRAKLEIWTEPERYKEKGRAMGKAITIMIEQSQANGGDSKELTSSLKLMAKACKGCHKDFREEK